MFWYFGACKSLNFLQKMHCTGHMRWLPRACKSTRTSSQVSDQWFRSNSFLKWFVDLVTTRCDVRDSYAALRCCSRSAGRSSRCRVTPAAAAQTSDPPASGPNTSSTSASSRWTPSQSIHNPRLITMIKLKYLFVQRLFAVQCLNLRFSAQSLQRAVSAIVFA